jgi:hypothetical protein
MEILKAWGKKILKGTATVLALTLAVMIATHLLVNLYDQRVVLGVIAGKVGFDAIYTALGRIKGLE